MPEGIERRKNRFTGGGRKIPGIGRTGIKRMKEHGVFKEQQKLQYM